MRGLSRSQIVLRVRAVGGGIGQQPPSPRPPSPAGPPTPAAPAASHTPRADGSRRPRHRSTCAGDSGRADQSRKPVRLVDMPAGQRRDQRVIAHLVAEPGHHGRHLRIEQRAPAPRRTAAGKSPRPAGRRGTLSPPSGSASSAPSGARSMPWRLRVHHRHIRASPASCTRHSSGQ